MEVHKPKPFHGWREFLKEVGIIVIGVLIALSAEQVVEAIHWQHKMAELRGAMRDELTADDGPEAYFRLAVHDCLERYLDRLQSAAEAGSDRRQVAAQAGAYPGYGPALLTWDLEGWRSLLAADGAAHMPPEELAKWNAAYVAVPELQHYAQDEREAVGQLTAIRPAPGPMSVQELEALARAVQRLRSDNDWMQNYASLFFSGLRRAQLKPDERALQSLYHSHALALFSRDLEAAHLTGCALKPDISHPDLRMSPSMPEPGVDGGPRSAS